MKTRNMCVQCSYCIVDKGHAQQQQQHHTHTENHWHGRKICVAYYQRWANTHTGCLSIAFTININSETEKRRIREREKKSERTNEKKNGCGWKATEPTHERTNDQPKTEHNQMNSWFCTMYRLRAMSELHGIYVCMCVYRSAGSHWSG